MHQEIKTICFGTTKRYDDAEYGDIVSRHSEDGWIPFASESVGIRFYKVRFRRASEELSQMEKEYAETLARRIDGELDHTKTNFYLGQFATMTLARLVAENVTSYKAIARQNHEGCWVHILKG